VTSASPSPAWPTTPNRPTRPSDVPPEITDAVVAVVLSDPLQSFVDETEEPGIADAITNIESFGVTHAGTPRPHAQTPRGVRGGAERWGRRRFDTEMHDGRAF
jgi:hypothetical protein